MSDPRYSSEFLEILAESKEIAEKSKHRDVLPIHALRAIASARSGVFQRAFTVMGTNLGLLRERCDKTIAALPAGDGSVAVRFAEDHPLLVRSAEEAEQLEIDSVLSEHLLLAIIRMEDPLTKPILDEFKIGLREILKGVIRVRTEYAKAEAGSYRAETKKVPVTALERFGRDLTELAAEGALDPVIGGDDKIREVIKVLLRRRKSNPILVGEAGTGKTAICEGLAQRIAERDVPESLRGVRLVEIDMGTLLAGASAPGEFEERFRQIIAEVEASEGRVVLMIDEVHSIMSASGGSVSAADLLKPALARGRIRLIGLTTQEEYKKHIEKDKAVGRRFDRIEIDEPSIPETVSILRGLRQKYELFHGIRIRESAIQAAPKLSARYLSGRFLPDKALDLVDRVCSQAQMELLNLPGKLDGERRELQRLELELEGVKKDESAEAVEARQDIEKRIGDIRESYVREREAWDLSCDMFNKRKDLEKRLDELAHERDALLHAGLLEKSSRIDRELIPQATDELAQVNGKLDGADKGGVQVRDYVDEKDVATEVSRITGIPMDSMVTLDDESRYQRLEEALGERVIGQRTAITEVSRVMRNMIAGLKEPQRPIGAFLFLGPTGVGKTELAKAIAQFMFGDERFITRIDMSEYSEKHSVARLIGAPPGYVGYEEGGVLTEAVRNNPYSLILLDEVEKAHPSTFDVFLQVLEDGRLTDGKGRSISFADTLIILTSNLAANLILEMTPENRAEVIRAVDGQVAQFFKPELRNRLTSRIIFEQLGKEELDKILTIQLKKLQSLVLDKKIRLIGASAEAREEILRQGLDPRYGARPLIRFLEREVRGKLADQILTGGIVKGDSVRIVLANGLEIAVVPEKEAGPGKERA